MFIAKAINDDQNQDPKSSESTSQQPCVLIKWPWTLGPRQKTERRGGWWPAPGGPACVACGLCGIGLHPHNFWHQGTTGEIQ